MVDLSDNINQLRVSVQTAIHDAGTGECHWPHCAGECEDGLEAMGDAAIAAVIKHFSTRIATEFAFDTFGGLPKRMYEKW